MIHSRVGCHATATPETPIAPKPAMSLRTPLESAASSGTRLTANLVCGHAAGSGHAAHGHDGGAPGPAEGIAEGAARLEAWPEGVQSTCGVWLLPTSHRTVRASTTEPAASVRGIHAIGSVGGACAKSEAAERRTTAGTRFSSAVHGIVGSASSRESAGRLAGRPPPWLVTLWPPPWLTPLWPPLWALLRLLWLLLRL